MDEALTERVLEDYRTAPIPDKLRVVLGLLEKMTLEPKSLTPADIQAALAQGISREALKDAFHVAFLFNIYDRLADTMGWHVPAPASGYYQSAARRLLSRGYR